MKFSYMSLFIVCTLVFIALQPVVRAAPDQTDNPEYWYNKGVDLANEGKYDEALAATDHALALNASFPRAHAMRSGLLVMVGRYDEAITEADLALATKENLTITFFSAWANKGDALRHLGRIEEARAAFAMAQKFDPTFIPPDMNVLATSALPTSAKSPLSGFVVLAGLAGGCAVSYCLRSKI
jgi:tetratricopeptide (TPR) repeat protein